MYVTGTLKLYLLLSIELLSLLDFSSIQDNNMNLNLISA